MLETVPMYPTVEELLLSHREEYADVVEIDTDSLAEVTEFQ